MYNTGPVWYGIQAEGLVTGHDLLDITPSPFVMITMKSNSGDTVQSKV